MPYDCFYRMALNLLVDKSHRILGEVAEVDEGLDEVDAGLAELQEAVEGLRQRGDADTVQLVNLVAVTQRGQVGVAVGLVILAVLVTLALLCLCALWCRMRKLKVNGNPSCLCPRIKPCSCCRWLPVGAGCGRRPTRAAPGRARQRVARTLPRPGTDSSRSSWRCPTARSAARLVAATSLRRAARRAE